MEKVKYLILGAGPAGLAFANQLKQMGETSFLVLEKEKEAGGLCRSRTVDGAPLDIGGGHFLDVRRPAVTDFLFRFMPEEEWNHFKRDSHIQVDGNEISHPIEANIWQMELENQVAYLKSIAQAGCNQGKPEPESFVDWIYWKLGDRIAESYMIPYNRKMFGEDLDSLGTYWLEKLPNVSFEETLRSCLTRKAYGKQPGHARFYYPKRYGYGEVWLRMAEAVRSHMVYEAQAAELHVAKRQVKTADGCLYEAAAVINTAPWTSFAAVTGLKEETADSIARLRHSAVQIAYVPEEKKTEAQWIYYPDRALSYHRILVRSNFCPDSRGYWTETNADRIGMEQKEPVFSYLNEYAYPLNTAGKPAVMQKLLAETRAAGVYGLGRWGEQEHYNSDATVERALSLAEKIGRSM